VDIIGIICTGELPAFSSTKIIVKPLELLLKTVEALGIKRLGVLVPSRGQVKMAIGM